MESWTSRNPLNLGGNLWSSITKWQRKQAFSQDWTSVFSFSLDADNIRWHKGRLRLIMWKTIKFNFWMRKYLKHTENVENNKYLYTSKTVKSSYSASQALDFSFKKEGIRDTDQVPYFTPFPILLPPSTPEITSWNWYLSLSCIFMLLLYMHVSKNIVLA